MRRALLAIAALTVLASGAVDASDDPGEFSIRSVNPLREEQLVTLRALVETDPDAHALAISVREEARRLVDEPPTPLAVIDYEGLVNTDPGRVATVAKLRQMDTVAALVRDWQLSRDPHTARSLRGHISSWASRYVPTGNDVNENKLYPLIVAYHHTRDGFSSDDRDRIDTWLQRIGQMHDQAVRESTHFTNRYTKHVRLLAVIGATLGRSDWQATAEEGVKRFVSESLRADGTSLDLERRDTLTYHASALRPVIELAMLAGTRGAELYAWESAQGGSIRKSVNYLVPYALGDKTREEWTNSTVDLDHRRAAAGLEHYRLGRLYDPQDALNVMQEACYFDPDLERVVAHLLGSDASRFPTWQMLVNEAARAPTR